ncbi:MAG: hypothetical protein PQJ50_18505 [Spirochaetales bacterium]|nr:hypothetical protein [Spirochaetales bacterium]
MKEMIFKTSRFIVFAVALGQLALSQVHIAVITRVFDSSIGFYLFLFVISGLVMGFNTSAIHSGSRIPLFIAGCAASLVTGLLYLRMLIADVLAGNLLTWPDIHLSLIYSIGAMTVYLAGTVSLLATRNYDD